MYAIFFQSPNEIPFGLQRRSCIHSPIDVDSFIASLQRLGLDGGNAADVKELMALEVEGAGAHRWYRVLKLDPTSVPCHFSIF